MVKGSGRDSTGGKAIGGDSRYESAGGAGEEANRLYCLNRTGINRRDLP